MSNKTPKPSACTGASKSQDREDQFRQSFPTKPTSSKVHEKEPHNDVFSSPCLGRHDLSRAVSSPTSGNGARKPLGLSSALKVNRSTDSAEQPSQASMLTPSGSANSNRPKTRMSLDTRLIGRRVAGGSWSSMERGAANTGSSEPPTTPKKRKESVDESSSPPRSSRRPRVDGPLSTVEEEATGLLSQSIVAKDPEPKQASPSKEACPETPEDTSIVISPSVTPRRLKTLIAKKKIRHRLEPFSPTVMEVAHRKDQAKSQTEQLQQTFPPLPEIVITPPIIACPDNPVQLDAKNADNASEQGAFLATLYAAGGSDFSRACFGGEMRYRQVDVTYTSASPELVLSRLVHKREKDDQSTRVLMLGMFRDHLRLIPKTYGSSVSGITQAQVLRATKPFIDRLTRALSRNKEEFWVPDSLKVVCLPGVPQEVSERCNPHLYRQEVLALADGIVVDVVNSVE